MSDQIMAIEIARLAREFAERAEHERNTANAFRITGRSVLAVQCEARAWAFDEAARRCREWPG